MLVKYTAYFLKKDWMLMVQLKHPNFERFIDFSTDNLTLKTESEIELIQLRIH